MADETGTQAEGPDQGDGRRWLLTGLRFRDLTDRVEFTVRWRDLRESESEKDFVEVMDDYRAISRGQGSSDEEIERSVASFERARVFVESMRPQGIQAFLDVAKVVR